MPTNHIPASQLGQALAFGHRELTRLNPVLDFIDSPKSYAWAWRNVSQVFSSRCNFWLLTFINPIEINLCREILQLESNFQHISIGDNEMNSFPPTFS